MVNEHSTIPSLESYINNAKDIVNVNSSVHEDSIVFEAYVGQNSCINVDSFRKSIPMLMDTYGATVTNEKTNNGTPYYRIQISTDGVLLFGN